MTTDCASICLSQWADRARVMHSPTWTDWQQETEQALREHRERMAAAVVLIESAKWALMDHDIDRVRENLALLERLF